MLQDKNVGWIRKRILFNGDDMNGYLSNTTSGKQEAAATTLATVDELGALGVVGLTMVAGELVNGMVRCPYDLDPAHEIGFKVVYTGTVNTTTGTTSWILLQDAIAEGGVIAVATTALDTVIPLLDQYADTAGNASGTDQLLQNSSRGIRTSIGLTPTQIEGGACLLFSLELDAVTAAYDTTEFIGIEMDYTPKKMKGEGLLHPAPLTNTI